MAQNQKKNGQEQSDGLALVVGGLFVLALVFGAYNYFNKRPKEDQSQSSIEKIKDAINQQADKVGGSDEDLADINGDAVTDIRDATATDLGRGGPIAEVYWVANDYNQGDISGDAYTVQPGDTLWEIAEAVYGNGSMWTQILNANSDTVGYLPGGQQALIMPGQTLVIPA